MIPNKRSLGLLIGLFFLLFLFVFGIRTAAAEQEQRRERLFFVCDADSLIPGTIQSEIWSSLQDYAGARAQTCKLITAQGSNPDARSKAVEQMLPDADATILCYGEDYATLLAQWQERYPSLRFLLLGAEPRSATDGTYQSKSNTHNLLLSERDLGFLAGYALVMQGERSLGYCATREAAYARNYGHGFIEGANLAAARLQLPLRSITLRHWYTDADDTPAQIEAALAAWYQAGVRSIFIGDPDRSALYESAHCAKKQSSGRLLSPHRSACDSACEDCLLLPQDYASAMTAALDALRANGGIWPADRAGRSLELGLADGAVSLAAPGLAWQWDSFTPEAHTALLAEFSGGTLTRPSGKNQLSFPAAPYVSLWVYG